MKIDKSKWNTKAIAECGNIITGNTPSTKDIKNYSANDYCFIKPGDINATKVDILSSSDSYLSEYGYENARQLPTGSVLVTCIGIIGKVGILHQPSACNQQINAIIPNKSVSNRFIAYSLFNKRKALASIANGPVVPIINKKTFSNIKVNIPSFEVQCTIATELDTLQSLITQYREQLNDYDKLAQSIFYEMFGDVVVNEKGWTCNPFHKLFSLRSGDGLTAKQQISGDFLVYGGNGINGSHTQYNKDGEYIIIGRVGAYCGNVRYVSGKFWLTDNAFELKEKLNPQNKYYLQYLLQKLNLGHYAHKAAQPVISNTVLKDISIPLPPLPLQQQFASRIESIEAQKALIKQQLADAQTLFDSRMQYYFD